jgi:chromate reductase, NAD(P)H dehydrogenase (quinone)
MKRCTVGYLVGSLSRESINRKLAKALVRLAPDGLELREIGIADLPLYNRDLDGDYPAVATAFKEAVAGVDAILFVTPEYNRSIPGALKNAIDWGSRPYGSNAFSRKPTGIIGTSPGKIGTAVGQQHLRSILAYCNAPLMNSLEAYIEFTDGLITDAGEVTVESTAGFLRNYMEEFHAFITRVHTALSKELEPSGSSDTG